MNRSRPEARAYWLGRVPYRGAWELQRALVEAVREGRQGDTLLLLEHPHVFTIGRSGSGDHLLWDEAECRRRQVEVIWSDRGGDATYHGPAYLAGLGIESEPGGPGLTGVWSGGEKVAAIGVKMNHSVVSHGFALNLATDLAYFDGIVPCGLVGKRATSVEKLGAGRIATAAAARAYAECFATAFALDITWGKASELAGLKGPDPVPTLSVVGR